MKAGLLIVDILEGRHGLQACRLVPGIRVKNDPAGVAQPVAVGLAGGDLNKGIRL